MSQQDFETHLRPAYEIYLKEHKSELFVSLDERDLTFEEFLDKIKNDYSFPQMWGIDTEFVSLSDEERYKVFFSLNYETGMEFNPELKPDYDNEYWEPTPTRKVKVTYNNRTFEFYEKVNEMKPSDVQPKIPLSLWSYDEVFPRKYKLVRERDGLTKAGNKYKWIEWNEDGTFQSSHDEPGLGRSFILDPHSISYNWMTTVVTEIIEQREDYIKFRTSNSVYELFIQN